jgi:DNA-directed RNA polymerase subunit RPC12/RpoP
MGITVFKCPYCKRIIEMTDGLQNRMKDIGTPLMKCPHCGGQFKTGAREWVDLPKSRKTEIWVKFHIVYGIVYGAILGLGAWAIIVEAIKLSKTLGTIIGSIVFLFLFYSMHKAYRNQINESLERKPNSTRMPDNTKS